MAGSPRSTSCASFPSILLASSVRTPQSRSAIKSCLRAVVTLSSRPYKHIREVAHPLERVAVGRFRQLNLPVHTFAESNRGGHVIFKLRLPDL